MNENDDSEMLLTADEVAKLFGITTRTLRDKIMKPKGTLPYVKLSERVVRFRKSDVQDFIDQQSV